MDNENEDFVEYEINIEDFLFLEERDSKQGNRKFIEFHFDESNKFYVVFDNNTRIIRGIKNSLKYIKENCTKESYLRAEKFVYERV
ncbi:MAG: hypothetical protein K9H48_07720 [Melioribacteraceae bacterium]|nr:hypothetical protein [Melioribacteraceae bacterium]